MDGQTHDDSMYHGVAWYNCTKNNSQSILIKMRSIGNIEATLHYPAKPNK